MTEGKIYSIVFPIFTLLDPIALFRIIGTSEKGTNLIHLLV